MEVGTKKTHFYDLWMENTFYFPKKKSTDTGIKMPAPFLKKY